MRNSISYEITELWFSLRDGKYSKLVASFILARDSVTNKIVHISDVPEGYNNAECVGCDEKLIASKYHLDTRKVACYFRHKSSAGCSSMTALHRFAQEVILERRQVHLPACSVEISVLDFYRLPQSRAFHKPSYLAELSEVTLESPYPGSNRIADVAALEATTLPLYVEIKVHHETDVPKQKELQAASLDAIEIDLSALVDRQDLSKEELIDAVISKAPRQWISHARYNDEINELQKQLRKEVSQADQALRVARKERSTAKKQWRQANQELLELVQSYSVLKKRQHALRQLQRWCKNPDQPEYIVYNTLMRECGKIPEIVNVPVKGELAFKAHRIYWQSMIFRHVIQAIYDNTLRQVTELKGNHHRQTHNDKLAWLSRQPGVTPQQIYQQFSPQLPLNRIALNFEGIAGSPLQESFSTRAKPLRYVTAKEYEILPKPVPAIRRYLKVLAQSDILEASGDTFYIPYQKRPDLQHPVKDYAAVKDKGNKQYK